MANSEKISWNECLTFTAGSSKSWGAEYYDDSLVMIGVNKTTGDYLIYNNADIYESVGGLNVGTTFPTARTRMDEFFATSGEKSAFLVGCDTAHVKCKIERFKEELSKQGVDVIEIEPDAFKQPFGYGVLRTVYVNPANAEVSIINNQTNETTKIKPFGEISPTLPSQLPRIEMVCSFVRQATARDQTPMTGYTFKDDTELSKHIAYVSSRIKRFQEALPKTEEYIRDLKASFSRASALGNQEMIRPEDASNFPKAMEVFAKKLIPFYDAVVELNNRKNVSPASKKAIRLLVGAVTQTYMRLREIASQEGISLVVADAEAKLDDLRNLGGRAIGSSNAPIKSPPALSPPS